MIKCPSCNNKFRNKYDICSNCDYKLTDEDKTKILLDKQSLIDRSVNLTLVNSIVLILWIVSGIFMFFILNDIIIKNTDASDLEGKGSTAIIMLFFFGNILSLGAVLIIYLIFNIAQIIVTIINIIFDINMLTYRFFKPLKKKGLKLLLINLSMLILNYLSIVIFLTVTLK